MQNLKVNSRAARNRVAAGKRTGWSLSNPENSFGSFVGFVTKKNIL